MVDQEKGQSVTFDKKICIYHYWFSLYSIGNRLPIISCQKQIKFIIGLSFLSYCKNIVQLWFFQQKVFTIFIQIEASSGTFFKS